MDPLQLLLDCNHYPGTYSDDETSLLRERRSDRLDDCPLASILGTMDVSSYVNRRGKRSVQIRLDISEAKSLAESGDSLKLVEAVRAELARLESSSEGLLEEHSGGFSVSEELGSLLPPPESEGQ